MLSPFSDSTLARLMQIQFRSKFKRQDMGDSLKYLGPKPYEGLNDRTMYDADDTAHRKFGQQYYDLGNMDQWHEPHPRKRSRWQSD